MPEPPPEARSRWLSDIVRGAAFFIGVTILSGLFGAALIGLLALLVT